MIETIGLILFVLAILFVAMAAPKPAGKKEKNPVPQQPLAAADEANNGTLTEPSKPADHSPSPPQSPDM